MTAPEVLDAPEPAPSTGVVAPRAEQTSDGVLDPTWWQGLDAQSQGEVAESLPQPPQNEAEWQYKAETTGQTSLDAPQISALSVSAIATTSAHLSWSTNKDATTEVEYGSTQGSYDTRLPTDGSHAPSHDADLTGLATATTYYVRVASRDADGNLAVQETQFTTL